MKILQKKPLKIGVKCQIDFFFFKKNSNWQIVYFVFPFDKKCQIVRDSLLNLGKTLLSYPLLLAFLHTLTNHGYLTTLASLESHQSKLPILSLPPQTTNQLHHQHSPSQNPKSPLQKTNKRRGGLEGEEDSFSRLRQRRSPSIDTPKWPQKGWFA